MIYQLKRFGLAALIQGMMATGLVSVSVCADDWPQWRGPDRNGLSQETGLLKEWPDGGPKVVWELKEIGSGYSTPAVVGERLYLMSNEGMNDEFVLALAVKDGGKVWSTRVGKVGPNQGPQYPGSRSTPTVDGDLIYALGSDGDLACLELETGKVRWQKNLRTEFGGQPGNWAYAESPLIDGDALVCTPGGSDATLVSLNKKNGEVIWKSSIPGGDQAAYASVIVVETAGVRQYVQFLQKGLVGVDAKTGKFLWRYDQTAQGSPANIPTPVARDGYVYTATRSGGGLVQLKGDQGNISAEQVYFASKIPNSIGGAVLVGGYLYGTAGQTLLCVEFTTGELKWEERSAAPGSICHADGRLYLHAENGDLALVEATPEGYREKGRFTPPDQPERPRGAKAWTYPVIADGRLFVRDLGTLRCYDVAEDGATR
jgi:outer membrane protein assembly factor BamB